VGVRCIAASDVQIVGHPMLSSDFTVVGSGEGAAVLYNTFDFGWYNDDQSNDDR